MKREILFILVALMPMLACAYDAKIDGIYYNFSENEAEVTYVGRPSYIYSDYSGDVVIPTSVTYEGKTYSVTSIGYKAFYDCYGLTSITIPESVTSIGIAAFSSCSDLTSITIPESVTSIGNSAFSNCSGLTSITIPESVTSIGDSAFYECRGLQKVIVPDIAAWNSIMFGSYESNPLFYAHHLFKDETTEITELVIPDNVTSIGGYAFLGCSGLTSIIIPKSVTSIGYGAFKNCFGLTSISIPESVTSIGNGAFRNCSGLTSISIPESVTSIGYLTFDDCFGLTSITIPNSVRIIGDCAFRDCSGLTSISIPESVTSIGNSAFAGCYFTNESFVNKSSLTSSDNWGVTLCDKETTDGLLISGDSVIRCRPWVVSITIPNSVTSIGNEAFKNCIGLTSITIPNSVTSIGYDAFRNCSGLTSITIGNSVTTIGEYAFLGCLGLVSVTLNSNYIVSKAYTWESGLRTIFGNVQEYILGDNIRSIGDYTFRYCTDLTSITIPNSVTCIGDYAFMDCTSLKSLNIPNSVRIIEDGVFSGCIGLTSVTIPNGVTIIRSEAFMDCTSLKSLNIPNSVTTIGGSAFSGCSGLTSVTIPNSVTSIWNYVFYGCSGLTSVTIPNSVTSIGDKAFYKCSGLTSITIPESVTSIGGSAFDGCSSLKSVHITDLAAWCNIKFSNTDSNPLYYAKRLFMDGNEITDLVIPNSVSSISGYAFCNCSGLTSITIPNSVTSIGERAFGGCGSLTSVTIPNSVTTIGGSAFSGCTGLESVTIGSGVTNIGNHAFYGCYGLTSITIGSGVTSIGYLAFSGCNSLTDVYCYAESVPITYGNAFSNSPISSATLYVTAGSLEAYKAKSPWNGFGTIVPMEEENDDDTYINGIYYDFSDNKAKVIKGENAYSGDVVIPASVTYKGKSYNVTSVGDFAFFQCDGLTSVSIPESITNIGQLAFATCSGLTSINVPESVTNIGVGTFAECTGLSLVSLPESLTSISESLLSGCSSLTSITIPKNVTIIGERAFAYCSKLEWVYCYAEQVPGTADNAFENTPIQSAVLQVPTSSAKEQYKKTTPWSGFGTIIAQTDDEFTEDGLQLDNSSFDDWHTVGEGNQILYNPWKEGGSRYWDTGNRGATTVGPSNSTYVVDSGNGRTYANLQSKYILIKFAAGNIFTGQYLSTDGTDGILSLGRPFNGYPTKLQFDYKYTTSIINKGGNKWDESYSRYISQETYERISSHTVPDSCCIWVALIGDKDEEVWDDTNVKTGKMMGDGETYPFIIRTKIFNSDTNKRLKLFDPNDENVIAYGQFTSGDDQTDWTTKTITLDYRRLDEEPKYIIVVATSSKYGDFFIGSDQSLLKLDNLKLLYDESIPIERETFFAEQANGVQMEFKVISKENKTCQVGTGTRPCISIDTSGEISIPSEAEGYTVVAVGEKAFDDCCDLTSITIPNSVTSIGGSAFTGCRLRNVLLRSITPPAIDEDSFSKNIYNHTILYIPNGSWDEYVFNSNWYQFINIRETTTEEEQLSMLQTYTMMDANTFAYSVYDPVNDCIGAVGVVNEDNPNHCWQIIETDGNHYLYNLGAKKFVTSSENSLNLTNDAKTIEIGNGKEGIVLGKQEGKQWAFVSNERMNVDQSITDAIIAVQGASHLQQTGALIYDLQGQKLSAPQKGINIIRMSDGTIKKVLIK